MTRYGAFTQVVSLAGLGKQLDADLTPHFANQLQSIVLDLCFTGRFDNNQIVAGRLYGRDGIGQYIGDFSLGLVGGQ